MAFTLDTYTVDVPDLDEATAQEISVQFIGTPSFKRDASDATEGGATDSDGNKER